MGTRITWSFRKIWWRFSKIENTQILILQESESSWNIIVLCETNSYQKDFEKPQTEETVTRQEISEKAKAST